MIWNTRFNPTVNGPLHVGHVYAILVNQAEAQRSGGRFGIRFDDTQRCWNYLLGQEKVEEFKQWMREDLAWLGIEPDYWVSQAEMLGQVEDMLSNVFHYYPEIEHFSSEQGAEQAGGKHHYYPYTERLTVEKVIMDVLGGVTWLIRGMDLITEDCLYKHFCSKLLIATPRTTYLPRLQFEGDAINKTGGKYKIRDFRARGMLAQDVLDCLAHDCLRAEGWFVEHVRLAPTLGDWAAEALK